MQPVIEVLSSRAALKTFIYLPEKLQKVNQQWVPPFYLDEWRYFNPRKNSSFSRCDTFLALARVNGRAVGRIMGIINHEYNARRGERNARFCHLACPENPDVLKALVRHTEDWADQMGMDKVVGPLGFSDKDPQGLMVEGFQEAVTITTNQNSPWFPDTLEELGYVKETDLVCYKLRMPGELPPVYCKIQDRAIGRNGCRLLEFDSQKALRPWIVPVFELVNDCFMHIYGFDPVQMEEMQAFARQYLPLLNPRFVKLVTDKQGALVGFLIGMPEMSQGIRRARGRLLPFGWYHIWQERRHSPWLTMLLGAIRKDWRGRGLDATLGAALFRSAREAGILMLDSHLIMENNLPMRAEYERMGGVQHKRFRIFGRQLL